MVSSLICPTQPGILVPLTPYTMHAAAQGTILGAHLFFFFFLLYSLSLYNLVDFHWIAAAAAKSLQSLDKRPM